MKAIDRWGTFLGNVLLPHSDLAHPLDFPYLFPFQCQFQTHFRAQSIENHFDDIFRIKMRRHFWIHLLAQSLNIKYGEHSDFDCSRARRVINI